LGDSSSVFENVSSSFGGRASRFGNTSSKIRNNRSRFANCCSKADYTKTEKKLEKLKETSPASCFFASLCGQFLTLNPQQTTK
jgi:hypothetical protein